MEDLEEGMDETVEVKTKGQLFAEHLKRQFAVLDDDVVDDVENEPKPCKGQKIEIEVSKDAESNEIPKEEIGEDKTCGSDSIGSLDEEQGDLKEPTSAEIDDTRYGQNKDVTKTIDEDVENLVCTSDKSLEKIKTSEAILVEEVDAAKDEEKEKNGEF